MKKIAIVLVVVALAGAGVVAYLQRERVEPIVVLLPAGPTQPRVSPQEAGIDPLAIDEAVQYAGPRNTRALVIGHGGHIVFEKYWDDTTLETAVDLPGFAPVLAAIVTGTMMNDRLIKSLDAPTSNYITEGAETPLGATTLRELMAQDNAALDVEASANRLALVLERISSQPYQALVVERLWKPLEAGDLRFEGAGGALRPKSAGAGCCIRARLGDWMRVAELRAQGFAAWLLHASGRPVRHPRRGAARSHRQAEAVDSAVTAADDPARRQRAAGGSRLGRGDHSQQHHSRHRGLAAAFGG